MSAQPAPRKIRVALLFGGRSGEHSISCATAAGVLGAIDRDRYDVVPIGITRTGRWVLAADDAAALALNPGALPQVPDDPTTGEVSLSLTAGDQSLRVCSPGEVLQQLGDIDVVFPVLHGPFGEDGTLQGLLELADLPYVGSGVLASAVGMDKHFMKVVCAGAGIPVGPFEVVHARQWAADPDSVTRRVSRLELPLFVKPARAGSSLGISRIESLDDLPAAITEAARHDPKVLVEQGIAGREIECAVLGGLGGGPTRASLPGEIIVDRDKAAFYDFDAKYLDDAVVQLACPADLSAEMTDAVRDIAVRTFDAIEAEGLSRVDVFVTPEGAVILNEINTMPGFTPISMFPRMWQATGISYPELIDDLITQALERPIGLR